MYKRDKKREYEFYVEEKELEKPTQRSTMYISTFGFVIIPDMEGVPIEVGAEGRNNFLYNLKDNTGDNISEENPYYGELTGLYWIWKNADYDNEDIVGFCHYNKTFLLCMDKITGLIVGGMNL